MVQLNTALGQLDAQLRMQREDDDSEQRIRKARMKMVIQPGLRSAFFASQLMPMPFVLDRKISTMSTNGKSIRFNPTFVLANSMENLIGVLAHEVMHCVLLHHLRRGQREMDQWNQACDLAINPLLRASGFSLPDEGIFPGSYPYEHLKIGLSAEEYYEALKKPPIPLPPESQDGQSEASKNPSEDDSESKRDQSNDQENKDEDHEPETSDGDSPSDSTGNPSHSPGSKDPGGCGGVEDYPEPSPAEQQEQESRWKVSAMEALETAKRMGCLPGHFEKLVEAIVKPKIDYRDLLRYYLSELAHNNYSWRKPNSRYLYQDLYLPGVRGHQLSGLVLALDTSGSIFADPKQLSFLMGELQTILESYECTDVTVLCHDTRITHSQVWNTTEGSFTMIPRGGGGTSHNCIMEYIAEKQLDPPVLICLTDMYSTFPREEPPYPIIWLSTTKTAALAPSYGHFIYIGD